MGSVEKADSFKELRLAPKRSSRAPPFEHLDVRNLWKRRAVAPWACDHWLPNGRGGRAAWGVRRVQAAASAVRAKLERLERGEWDGSVACALGGCKSAIPVYEAKPLDNLRILWQARACSIQHSVVGKRVCAHTYTGMHPRTYTNTRTRTRVCNPPPPPIPARQHARTFVHTRTRICLANLLPVVEHPGCIAPSPAEHPPPSLTPSPCRDHHSYSRKHNGFGALAVHAAFFSPRRFGPRRNVSRRVAARGGV